MIQGALIGFLGTMAGVGLGVLLAKNIGALVASVEQALGMKFLSSDVYLINSLPSELNWPDVYLIGADFAAVAVEIFFHFFSGLRAGFGHDGDFIATDLLDGLAHVGVGTVHVGTVPEGDAVIHAGMEGISEAIEA